ncbi:Ig-like domain-containing protein [Pseudomonas stutzeri]|nr:Ig-like domain-containing protein [Stutzerimonas stutzeri]
MVAGTFVTAQGGSIVIAADGSYTYTPPADFHGTDTVDYTVTARLTTLASGASFTGVSVWFRVAEWVRLPSVTV